MNFDRSFEAMWGQQGFEVPEPPENLCLYAQPFSQWVMPVIANVEAIGSIVAVNQGVLRITHKYFEWRAVVPKNHRNRVGEGGHICIFHVFEAAYLKLKMIELSIQPPLITMPVLVPQPSAPPPPLPPVPLQIAGIFLGEEE